jgi:RNA-directed DNA polymerase
MNSAQQAPPAKVPPQAASQAGEAEATTGPKAAPSAQAGVWTERMLRALAQGVKGGKWHSLMDKVWADEALELAWQQVERNQGSAGVDRQTIAMFRKRAAQNLAHLQQELRTGTYRPRPVRRVLIPKPGSQEKRPLGIPTVRDRVAQAAARNAIEPIFEHEFAEHSYGFRPGRGCKDALRRVTALLNTGHCYIVDADLKSYFDTIPREPLMHRLTQRISDRSILKLVQRFLEQEIMDELRSWSPEAGTPQGAVLSPLLSNIYLDPLDHLMANAGIEMVRYADDFVILCRTAEAAQEALAQVRDWTEQAGLTLHPQKTRIADLTQGDSFEFLGYHFTRTSRWPRKKSVAKLKESIRSKTHRASGRSLEEIIRSVNRALRGWFEYFKHSNRYTFPELDGWIRMRLRSILRKRSKRKGRARGADHQRWPNAYFAKLGLFSLVTARAEATQSCHR